MCTYIYDYIDIKTNILILYIKTFFSIQKFGYFFQILKEIQNTFVSPYKYYGL